MDIRLCATVICTVAWKSWLLWYTVYVCDISPCQCLYGCCGKLACVGFVCLCARMHYGPVHDYIQWQHHSSMLAIIVHLQGWDHFFPRAQEQEFSCLWVCCFIPFILLELVDRISIWPHWCFNKVVFNCMRGARSFLITRKAQTSESRNIIGTPQRILSAQCLC